MCGHVCGHVCVCVCDMRVGMCADMRVDMCADMCVDVSVDMRGRRYIKRGRHFVDACVHSFFHSELAGVGWIAVCRRGHVARGC